MTDLFPFGRNARIQLEHGGDDTSTEHYRTVALLVRAARRLPGAHGQRFKSATPTDEQAHAYLAPPSSTVETVTSRYEWGVDTLDGQEVYPATTDTGRVNTGPSELTLAIQPDNFGVLLRRKLDYATADQRAEVWVSDETGAPFTDAGTWYLAGATRCLYSNPGGELAPPEPVAQTSNRRFRDDEFLIPRAMTEGRTQLRLRIVPQGTWTELRYDAYVWKLPREP